MWCFRNLYTSTKYVWYWKIWLNSQHCCVTNVNVNARRVNDVNVNVNVNTKRICRRRRLLWTDDGYLADWFLQYAQRSTTSGFSKQKLVAGVSVLFVIAACAYVVFWYFFQHNGRFSLNLRNLTNKKSKYKSHTTQKKSQKNKNK